MSRPISTRVNDDKADTIDAIADELDMSKSALLQSWIDDKLAEWDTNGIDGLSEGLIEDVQREQIKEETRREKRKNYLRHNATQKGKADLRKGLTPDEIAENLTSYIREARDVIEDDRRADYVSAVIELCGIVRATNVGDEQFDQLMKAYPEHRRFLSDLRERTGVPPQTEHAKPGPVEARRNENQTRLEGQTVENPVAAVRDAIDTQGVRAARLADDLADDLAGQTGDDLLGEAVATHDDPGLVEYAARLAVEQDDTADTGTRKLSVRVARALADATGREHGATVAAIMEDRDLPGPDAGRDPDTADDPNAGEDQDEEDEGEGEDENVETWGDTEDDEADEDAPGLSDEELAKYDEYESEMAALEAAEPVNN